MNRKKIIEGLNRALEKELASIVRYLHHSFIVTGVNRGPLVTLLRQRANDAVKHAIELGEKITALGGHPSVNIEKIYEPGDQTVEEMLRENLEAERKELEEYKKLLKEVGDDIPLEFMLKRIIVDEQESIEELEKYLQR